MKDGFEEDKLEVINKAFRLILPVLAKYIGKILIEKDKNNWWKKYVLSKLKNEHTIRKLPKEGSDDDCIESLDIPACLNIIECNWFDVFKDKMDDRQRTWAHALYDIRNYYESHYTTKTITTSSVEDISLELAIMLRFIRPIDVDVTDRIYEMKKVFENKFDENMNSILDKETEPPKQRPKIIKLKNSNGKLGENESRKVINKKLSLNIDRGNSAYSSINALVPQWSFNIHNSHFDNDLYIILEDQDDKKLYCFYLPKGTINDPKKIFNQRNDNVKKGSNRKPIKNKSIIIIPTNDKNFTNRWQGKEFQFIKFKILDMKYQ